MKPDPRPRPAEIKTPVQRLVPATAVPIKRPLELMTRAGATPIRIGTRVDIFA